jgi:hypothetical protein
VVYEQPVPHGEGVRGLSERGGRPSKSSIYTLSYINLDVQSFKSSTLSIAAFMPSKMHCIKGLWFPLYAYVAVSICDHIQREKQIHLVDGLQVDTALVE